MTILGVLIGVASVIAMMAIIEGVDSQVKGSIESMGSNAIYISRYPPNTNRSDLSDEERKRKPITFEDAEAVKENCPSVSAVAPQNHYFKSGGNIVKYRDKSIERPRLFGTSTDWEKVNNTYAARGRFFTESEDQHAARVCAIGSEIADGLFVGEDPIGKSIVVNSTKFAVVGVMEERNESFDDNANRFIAIPIGTFMKMYPWEKALWLAVSAKSADKMEQAQDEIVNALRLKRGVPFNKDNDFAVFTQESLMDLYEDITSTIVIVMLVISSIGLMVGGVGVLNIMLVSVTERTREIGVRKAIGARRANIVFQFLIEAVTLSCSGGLIGIGLGLLVGVAVAGGTGLPFGVPVGGVILGFGVAVGVGLISGVYPAFRASRVDPVISLRYE